MGVIGGSGSDGEVEGGEGGDDLLGNERDGDDLADEPEDVVVVAPGRLGSLTMPERGNGGDTALCSSRAKHLALLERRDGSPRP